MPSRSRSHHGAVARLAFVFAVCSLVWATSFRCHAQAPSASAAPQVLEVVRLADGAEYRGQISERIPGSHVVLITLTGEVKRFDWASISYAGAITEPTQAAASPTDPTPQAPIPSPAWSDTEPLAPSIAPRASSNALSLEFQANRYGIVWHAKSEKRGRQLLCTSPCRTQLMPDHYRFGLSARGREIVWDREERSLRSSGAWSGIYDSNRGERIAGGVVMGAGMLAALPMIFYGLSAKPDCPEGVRGDVCDDDRGTTIAVLGALTGALALAVGIILVSRPDTIRIKQSSGFQRPPGRSRRDGY